MSKKTDELMDILGKTSPDEIPEFLHSEKNDLIDNARPFSDFMRRTLEEHGIRQQRLFMEVGMSQQFGYRIISGQKHTKQRDTIIKLCFGGHFTLNETQKALRLYGFAPLYVRIPRDAVMIKAIQEEYYTAEQVDALLAKHQMSPLFEKSE